MELLMWWNLPFVLPFVAALFYLMLLATGTVAAEHEVEADADADTDIDHDYDHGVEHTVEHGHAHPQDSSMAAKALSFLGFGRVPFSLILMSFCFIWGFTGWAASKILGSILFFPVIYFWPSAGMALVSAVLLTRVIAKALSRVMPATETYAVPHAALVGKVAEVRFTVTPTSGTATLYDDYHTFKEVSCRIRPEENEVPTGAKVVLMRYEDKEGVFFVRQDPATSLRLAN